jgi:hypothetical protein
VPEFRRETRRGAYEIHAVENLPAIKTVDLRNGSLHLEIPIPATRQKTAAPLSGH